MEQRKSKIKNPALRGKEVRSGLFFFCVKAGESPEIMSLFRREHPGHDTANRNREDEKSSRFLRVMQFCSSRNYSMISMLSMVTSCRGRSPRAVRVLAMASTVSIPSMT